MNKAPEHSFEQLQKLLALKKHEQPPPGYFNNFSQKIVSRIEAEPRPSFWTRFTDSFQLRPGMVWAAGGTVSLLLLGGLIAAYSIDQSKPSQDGFLVESVSRTNQPTNVQPSIFDSLRLDTQPAAYQEK